MNSLTAPRIPFRVPAFRCSLCCSGRLVIDHREKGGVPFLHRGMWFDSFQHAMQYDRWLVGRKGLPTTEEAVADEERAERLRVELDQPSQPDQSMDPADD